MSSKVTAANILKYKIDKKKNFFLNARISKKVIFTFVKQKSFQNAAFWLWNIFEWIQEHNWFLFFYIFRTIQDPASQRLTWYKPPLTVLIIKKIHDAAVISPFIQLVSWFTELKRYKKLVPLFRFSYLYLILGVFIW